MILKPAIGTALIHRARSPRAKRICRYFKSYSEADRSDATTYRKKITVSLSSYQERFPTNEFVVVSDENISGRAIRFWKGKGVGPEQLAERLSELRDDVRDVFPTVRVIIGIRRQDQWLASRYAESSTVFQEFDQPDFDRRISELSQKHDFEPAYQWLDFHKVHSVFSTVLGSENLLMLSMERLSVEPEIALAELGSFIGVPMRLVHTYKDLIDENGRVVRNKLSSGSDTWRMRRADSTLHLKKPSQHSILARMADSNRNLEKLIPLYFV